LVPTSYRPRAGEGRVGSCQPDLAGLADERTISQLASLLYEHDARGRVAIERKEDARKRGVKSPDRAEAVTLAFAAPALGWNREPRGRARGRGLRQIDGQAEVGQDLLHHRPVLDGRQQAQPPAAVGARQHVKREQRPGAAGEGGPVPVWRPAWRPVWRP
jgi:hypothetical protein